MGSKNKKRLILENLLNFKTKSKKLIALRTKSTTKSIKISMINKQINFGVTLLKNFKS
jgi:hypothetical protein